MIKLSPVWQNYAYLKNQQTVQRVAVQNALEDAEERSTKGHSILRRATPRRAAGLDTFVPDYVPRKLNYETSAEEHSISGAVTNATLFSDSYLYDNFDAASKSRGRDQKLLSDATAALPPSTLSPLMASSRRTTAALPGRRFLSHTRELSPDIDDYPPKKSSYSLPTSHLQASAPPRPNITPSVTKYSRPASVPSTASKIASYKTTFDGSEQAPSYGTSTRLLGGYIPKSIFSSGSPHNSGTISPLYRSAYLRGRGRRSSFDSGMDSPVYSPTSHSRSTKLIGGYIPPRLTYRSTRSPYRSVSPYRSGTLSPVLPSFANRSSSSLLGGYIKKALSPSTSPYGSGAHTPVTYTSGTPLTSYDTYYVNTDDGCPDVTYRTRRTPKVFGTKGKVGNYYDRLRRKRAGNKGTSKYWPYIDVEDINSEVGDVLSDTESIPDYYNDSVKHWGDEGAVGGSYDTYEDTFNDSYMDEPDEYVPFKPRRRLESPGVFELSPYADTPSIPELPLVSKVPYVPSVSSNLSKYSKGNDLYLDSVVSSSSARALSAFKNNGWNGYDNASLVLSVEGDVVSPNTGGRYGFKYYHPPVPIVGSGLGSSIMSLPTPGVDSFFGTYVNKLKDIRTGIRNSLDSKPSSRSLPSANSDIGKYSPSFRELSRYTPSQYRTSPSSWSDSSLPYTSYRKRLQGGATQRVDVIELPVSERVLPSESLTLTFPDSSREHDKDKEPYKLTVLDKIKIKVSSEVPKSKASVASRRVARKGFTQSPPVRTEVVRYAALQSPVSSARPPIIIFVQPGATAARLGQTGPTYIPQGRAPPFRSRSVPPYRSRSSERGRSPSVAPRRAVVLQSTAGREYLWPLLLAQAPLRYRLRSLSPAYVSRRKPRRAKAAIVASTVEVEPRRRRTPRSKFAADKLRATRPTVEEAVHHPTVTTSLHASRPPMDFDAGSYQSDRKAIRDVDGFTKPRNLLSWQYRLESRVDPVDIMYKPGSFVRMRDQVRDAHDKLDRHRQLLDRYLVESGPTTDIQGRVMRKTDELEQRNPSSVSYLDTGCSSVIDHPPSMVPQQSGPPKQPVSELRRRLRRTVCRSRGEPNYYRDRE